ncbi:sulfite exporter TauE/SafE family protein [Streptomyces piniterrae]|uniref:Probable membrane transporter protein n=1 Tax=Streptomyces piniterrae TaxID=2571125 RepID=A0A4U0NPR7_9ACTN|nr:sulfite exporter TauE/SafE family protein [Streptomyces piniterrae]TJZ55902.1 sulfite exporter TauE/SafE family protein [Streptomyces piniterrae]
MTDLGLIPLGTLVLAALLVGVSKTAVSGVGALSVALFAAVLPARESTGALLPLLLVGDVLAVRAYRRHTDWPALLRLLPSVAAGILLGVVFVAATGDTVIRRTIGALLLTIVLHHLWQRARRRGVPDVASAPPAPGRDSAAATGRQPHARALFFGLVAGFATMVANAGGPAMSLYLLSSGFTVLGFLGTGAWFFLLVNLVKLPFSIALGLVTADALALDAALALAVLVGAVIGRAGVQRIDQTLFERLVLLFTALSGLNLLR